MAKSMAEQEVERLEASLTTAQQRIQEMTEASNQFARREISSGKLAEVLGCEDKHGFKNEAHAFCDAADYAHRLEQRIRALEQAQIPVEDREKAIALLIEASAGGLALAEEIHEHNYQPWRWNYPATYLSDDYAFECAREVFKSAIEARTLLKIDGERT